MRVHLESPADIGRLIRRLREGHGWSQRRLAKALGISQRYVHELEAGKPKRIDEQYFRILGTLGIRLTAEAPDPVDYEKPPQAREPRSISIADIIVTR